MNREIEMNKYVLLSGSQESGFYETSEIAIKKVIDDTSTVLFIVSRLNEFHKNDERAKRVMEWFQAINIDFESYELIDNRMIKKEQQEAIKRAKTIFILGGDTLAQIELFKENELDHLLKEHQYPILGISAGAINMAKRSVLPLTPYRDRSWVYKGVGLVDVTITPHFDKNDKKRIEEEMFPMSYDGVIYGLEENGTILVEGDNIEYYGNIYKIHNGEMKLFNI
jgi:peptidase E